jgi:hypothetical protein
MGKTLTQKILVQEDTKVLQNDFKSASPKGVEIARNRKEITRLTHLFAA